MRETCAFLAPLLFAWAASLHAQDVRPESDDRSKLAALFSSAADNGGKVTIPPGDYDLDGIKPISLRSEMTITAYGARFHLPEKLGDQARAVLFSGENVKHLRWFGGYFQGSVFDPSKTSNTWEPNANTRGIVITTTPGSEWCAALDHAPWRLSGDSDGTRNQPLSGVQLRAAVRSPAAT